MISDEERREVAASLRDTKMACDQREYPWMVEDLMQALGFGTYENGEEYIFDRLAELIDRPTCTEVEVTKEEGEYGPIIFHHELSCGHTCDTGWSKPPKYCNECGARIIEVDDGE